MQNNRTRVAASGPVTDYDFKLPAGEESIGDTVAAMAAVIESTRRSRLIRDLGQMLETPENIYRWMDQNVYFVDDPRGLEHIQHPDTLVGAVAKTGKPVGADCDDNAMLTCSLLLALNRPTIRPVIVVMSLSTKRQYHHVFAGWCKEFTEDIRRIVPMDSQAKLGYGKWPPAAKRMIYEVPIDD